MIIVLGIRICCLFGLRSFRCRASKIIEQCLIKLNVEKHILRSLPGDWRIFCLFRLSRLLGGASARWNVRRDRLGGGGDGPALKLVDQPLVIAFGRIEGAVVDPF